MRNKKYRITSNGLINTLMCVCARVRVYIRDEALIFVESERRNERVFESALLRLRRATCCAEPVEVPTTCVLWLSDAVHMCQKSTCKSCFKTFLFDSKS